MKKKTLPEKKGAAPKPEKPSRPRTAAPGKKSVPVKKPADTRLKPGSAKGKSGSPSKAEGDIHAVWELKLCPSFHVTVGSNPPGCPKGCFVDITIEHTYNTITPQNLAFYMPHGICVQAWESGLIQSVDIISATPMWENWLSGSTFFEDPDGAFVYWQKETAGPNDYSNALPNHENPTIQPLTVRIRFTRAFSPWEYCELTVNELTGEAVTDGLGGPYSICCQRTFNINPQAINEISLGPDISVCKGAALTLYLDGIPAGSTVRWYQFPPPHPPMEFVIPCPLGEEFTPCQTGFAQLTGSGYGSSYNTNILDETAIFVAMVECGCSVRLTNPKRVEVCSTTPATEITATGGILTVSETDNLKHSCGLWTGTLSLDPADFPCGTTIEGWQVRSRMLGYPAPCNPQWGAWTSWSHVDGSGGQTSIAIPYPGQIMQAKACQRQYEFHAVLKNACGYAYPSFTYVVDRVLTNSPQGSITASPPPPLCRGKYGKGTMLRYSGACAEVVYWEKREELVPCTNTWPETDTGEPIWTDIPESKGTCVWWTNNMTRTTQFRVKIRNGACPIIDVGIYSEVFTFTIIPPLFVTLSANQTILCQPGSVTLKAVTTYGPPPSGCSYPYHYQWYMDGQKITAAVDPTAAGTTTDSAITYTPKKGGNYSVVVSDTCSSAESEVIRICKKPVVVINAPCCLCKKPDGDEYESVQFIAEVSGCPENCPAAQPFTFLWNTGADTQSIDVHSPGLYSVTAHCANWPENCPPMKAKRKILPCNQ